MRLRKDQRGYSMTFWTVFFAFVLIPIMALSIELGRYFYARAEVAKAADAAALSAAAEIDQRAFEESGNLRATSATWANAQEFANLNDNYLAKNGVNVFITGIQVAGSSVQVIVSASLVRLFPSVAPDIVITETGAADIRALTQ